MTEVENTTVSGWPIGKKMTVAFLLIAVLPMSLVVYFNLDQSRKEVAEIAGAELTSLSQSTAYYIEQLLLENQRNSATLAGNPLVVQFFRSTAEERRALRPQINQLLENFTANHPDYHATGLLDARGIVQATLIEALIGKDRSFRDYFQASIKGASFISDILVGRSTGKPGVFLTNPIKTTAGEILGIDLIWLKADTIWNIVDQVKVGKQGIGYLVDQDGVIIAHPKRDLLYHSLGELPAETVSTISSTLRFGTAKETEAAHIPQSLRMDRLAARVLSDRGTGTFRYFSPLDQQYHIAGYTSLKNQTWTVIVDLPEAQFVAPLNRLRTVALLSIGLVALISLAISVLLARSITRPIRHLTKVAVDIKSDRPFDPDTIARVTAGNDEIAYLGRVFSSVVQSLQQSEEKYRILVENAPDLNYRTDLEGRIAFISNSVKRLSGYSVEEAIGMKMAEEIYFDPAERNLFLAELQQNGSVRDFESQLKRKDGSTWWVSTNAHFYRDREGNIRGVEGVARDVTERRAAENALKASETMFRSIFECSPLALVHIDHAGTVTAGNENLCTILGSSKAEIIGFNTIRSLKDQQMKAAITRALAGEKSHFEGEYLSAISNRTTPIRANFAPVPASNGSVSSVIGTLEDISEQYRTQEIIIQTEKMISVGGLAAGMAHEINNPLAGILQSAEVISNRIAGDFPANRKAAEAIGIPFEKISEYMESRNIINLLTSIKESGNRAAGIVRNMLSFSRKGESQFVLCDIMDLLDSTIELAENDFDMMTKNDFKKINIVREYPKNRLEVTCERSKIQQVFLNILKNGAQAMIEERTRQGLEEGTKNPTFILRTYSANNMACIEIEDNGPGMDEQIRKRVFEPFFTTKGVGTGTGLGMSVSYFIITENHAGRMSVKSVPGKSSTFMIQLPLQRTLVTIEHNLN